MECTEVLNIIGNIASIITVVGGIYGFCKWVNSRKAKIIATKYEHSDQGLFILFVYNNGPADAHNIKISAASYKHPIQTAAEEQAIDKLVYDLYGLTAEEIALIENQ